MHLPRLLTVTAILAAVSVSACRRDAPEPPAPPPPPPAERGPDMDSLRAYQDSVARAAEAARMEAERQRRIEAARATLTAMVNFDYDDSSIRSDMEPILRQKVEILRASPNVRLRLEGHTDERGSGEYNLALGSRRAQSVLNFFRDSGISENRFETTSYGEERPLVNRSDEAAWAQNRRVEFVIISGNDQINPPGQD
jgi:peptidoglycan-associated lipoprotein